MYGQLGPFLINSFHGTGQPCELNCSECQERVQVPCLLPVLHRLEEKSSAELESVRIKIDVCLLKEPLRRFKLRDKTLAYHLIAKNDVGKER